MRIIDELDAKKENHVMRELVRRAAVTWGGLMTGNYIFALAMLLGTGDAHSLADAAERSFFQLIAISVFVWAIASKNDRSPARKGFLIP